MSTISSLTAASGNDPVNDYLAIDVASLTSTQKINRNTLLNIASNPVGLSDTQTLTNKTLTSPTLTTPTITGTVAGTFTLPSTVTFPSTVATLTGTQTLTNKTLTSPTINSPSITNATISTDTITGYTTSNTGTIYGISVTTGAFTTSNIVPTASLQNNSVLSGKLGLSSGYTGGVASYSNSGSAGGTVFWINLGGLRMAWITGAASSTSAWLTVNLGTVGFVNAPAVVGTNTETTGSPPGWIETSSYTSPANGSPQTQGFSFLSRQSTSSNAIGTPTFICIGT